MQPIDAVPVRRPGRWIAAIVVALLAAAVVRSVATNPRFQWGTVGEMLFSERILHGLLLTLELTVIAMVAGVAIGIVVAVARMSPNRLLAGAGAFYVWLFRRTPVLVQLRFWSFIAALYPTVGIGPLQVDANVLITPSWRRSSAWPSTRRATWRKSCAPASCRSREDRPRRPLRSVCRGCRRSAGSCCRRRCA